MTISNIGRPKGSKNKPKTAEQLLEQIQGTYKKQGKTFKFTLEDIDTSDLSVEDLAAIQEEVKTNPSINVPVDFELVEDGNTDIDTWVCGNCQGELSGEVAECPHCSSRLRW